MAIVSVSYSKRNAKKFSHWKAHQPTENMNGSIASRTKLDEGEAV